MRSKHESALPLIVTHGWPGSIIEQMKIIDPLTNPTAHGANGADAFHIVIPSIPGYGFSGKPATTGWDPARIARAWGTLMTRLGYKRYVAQGGDWGAIITEQMAVQAPPGLIGMHTNLPLAVPLEISKALASGGPAPSGLSADEKYAYDRLDYFFKNGLAYALEMGSRPQTLYGLADSPIALAAWFLDHDAVSTGKTKAPSSTPEASPCRLPLVSSPTSFTRRLEAGQSGRTRTLSISTRSTKVGTSQLGNNRNSFQKSFARASNRCANRAEDFGARKVRAPIFFLSVLYRGKRGKADAPCPSAQNPASK